MYTILDLHTGNASVLRFAMQPSSVIAELRVTRVEWKPTITGGLCKNRNVPELESAIAEMNGRRVIRARDIHRRSPAARWKRIVREVSSIVGHARTAGIAVR